MKRKAILSYLSSFNKDYILVEMLYFYKNLEDFIIQDEHGIEYPKIDLIKNYLNEFVSNYLTEIYEGLENPVNDRMDVQVVVTNSDLSKKGLDTIMIQKVYYEKETINSYTETLEYSKKQYEIVKKFFDQENIDKFVTFFDAENGSFFTDNNYYEVDDQNLRGHRWYNSITDEISDLVEVLVLLVFGDAWIDGVGGDGSIMFTENFCQLNLRVFDEEWENLKLNIEI